MVTQEVATFRFMRGTVIWLDLIASVMTGKTPRLLSYHVGMNGADSPTKLENIMGCKNWLMFQIGRIAELHEQRTEAERLGQTNITEFQQTAADIGREIESGLVRADLASLGITGAELLSTTPDLPGDITRTFAFMAFTYLHLAIHGFHKLELLDTVISDAARTIRTSFPGTFLSAVVCPLFIIGSVARLGEEQQFFRDIFSSQPLLDPLLKHRAKILPVLEEVWTKRELSESFIWNDALGLSHDLLLI
jgi:hypothetical protein